MKFVKEKLVNFSFRLPESMTRDLERVPHIVNKTKSEFVRGILTKEIRKVLKRAAAA